MKKKSIIFLSILCLFLFGIFLGTIYHASIISLCDSLDEVDVENDSIPEGFSISPSKAVFIYCNILKPWNDHAWNPSIPVYADSESYYILGHKNYDPYNDPISSYHAKIYGIRINGHDGSVYDQTIEKWKKVGYIHITKNEFVKKLKIGSKEDEILKIVGDGFSTRFANHGQPSLSLSGIDPKFFADKLEENIADLKGVHYWCTDGEVVILYLKDEVIMIITEMGFIRI
jgi:hypothetical protein